jgi:hypothetical protein
LARRGTLCEKMVEEDWNAEKFTISPKKYKKTDQTSLYTSPFS